MSNNNLESLMRDVARTVQAEARRRELLPDVERRLAALDRPRPPRRRAFRLTVVGVATCAAAAAFVLLFPRARPLSYSVSGLSATAERAGGVGDRLVGPATGALALRFSDGSEVTLPARAQAHVDALDARGATVAVEDGTVEVSVVHRDRTRWEVRAGRYRIRVTGTRFSAGWDPRRQALTVTMHEGAVVVTGPGLKQPMRVVTGQRLRANAALAADPRGDDPTVSIEDAEMPELPEASAAPAARGTAEAAHETPSPGTPAVRAAPAAATAAPPPASAAGTRATTASPTARIRRGVAAPQAVARADAGWRTQASHARYPEALASAIREGWRADCDRLGVEDVLLLGDVARLAGDLPRSEEAYQIARRRFPAADRPVYALGLIAFEGRHDYAAAARLFDAYLRYFPRGPLVREAAGRLLEARLKTGETGPAREAAANYLRAYPDGPHAALARRTVGP